MNRDIIILGFPKCGTQALARELGRDPQVDLLAAPSGHLEFTWPLVRTLPDLPGSDRIRVHKYSAYIYDDNALRYLSEHFPDALYVLCIRQGAKALLSWKDMHRRLATHGRRKDHFAYLDRDFYANCSVADYYARYAHSRLRYDQYLVNLAKVLAPNQLVVVSQERLGLALPGIASALLAKAQGADPTDTPLAQAEAPHVSYADGAALVVPDDITTELADMDRRLQGLILTAGYLTFT